METTPLTFGNPQWLWGLVLLPVLACVYLWAHYRSRTLIAKIVAPRLRSQLAGSVSVPRRVLRALLLLLALAGVILALAQPRYGFIEKETKQKGRDVVIALDTSKSMLATDIAPDRLTRAKLFSQDLLRFLKGDRVGLIAFAGSAFLQAPLTLDYAAVTNALDEMDTSVIPMGGTNMAAAIATAREAFGKAEGQTRALVILTDGEELDADGIAAAKQATSEGIRIFTVGIGSAAGSLIPVRTQDGRQDFVRDASGKPVNSKLDTARLNEIAQATGGFFVNIGPDAAKEIFQKGIEPMELTENGVFTSRQPVERYQWPLGFAVFCLMLSVLPGDRSRKVPLVLAMLASLITTTTMSHADTNGIQEYKAGQYEQAEASFEKGLQTEPDSRPLQFNAGAAAYKSGKFDQAISYFTKALLSEDKKLREEASYNLANSLVRTGEAAQENEAKKTAWESAIEHYSEALNLNPENKLAKENREMVEKLLKNLEKQEQQDKKDQKDQKDQKEDQGKDQDKKDQDQKEKSGDQDKNDSEQKPEDKKESQKDPKDSQDKKPQEPQKNEGNSDKKNDQKSPSPSPTPGDKKEGELKSSKPEEPKPTPENQMQAQGEVGAEEEKAGQMSPSQARALLNSLRNEEEKVNLMEQQTSQEVLRDW